MNNYQSLTEQIIEICKKHPSIMKIESGDIYQKETMLDDEYCYAFLHLLPSSYTTNSITFNYNLIIADQVNQAQ